MEKGKNGYNNGQSESSYKDGFKIGGNSRFALYAQNASGIAVSTHPVSVCYKGEP